MYLEHFQLDKAPFTLTPDTGFFYAHASQREALNVLRVALGSGEGFIKVSGEVGTGKTLLCRQLLNTLGGEFVTAYIPNPQLTPAALRMAFAEELGLSFPRNLGQHRLTKLINERLVELNAAGKRAVLLIDEAQAMPEDSLEALRLLTNLETEHDKLLLVVLFGQPELDRRLAQASIRQLRQRIVFSYRLRPLDRAAVARYVAHRLRVAGHAGPPLFSPRALRRLHGATGGVPRLVNVVSHKALMLAYGRGERRVSARHVQRAAADTEAAHTTRLVPLWYGTLGAVTTLAGVGMYYVWSLAR
ncbi:MAG TPA: AAA family ATPase [Gammaproteobacteria bacterium]|nr:AAA family ATPase [Gammaproteobacteria bacterium]